MSLVDELEQKRQIDAESEEQEEQSRDARFKGIMANSAKPHENTCYSRLVQQNRQHSGVSYCDWFCVFWQRLDRVFMPY
jgi:hypothetical protein